MSTPWAAPDRSSPRARGAGTWKPGSRSRPTWAGEAGPGPRPERTKMAGGPPRARLPEAGAERSRALPSAPERPRSLEEPREPRGRERPRPGAWERRRRGGGGEAGCEWSGHFLFLCSFPQLWVVAAAGLRLPIGGGQGGVDSGPGTPRPAARSRAPARPPCPELSAPRLSARPPPPRPRERPRCRPSSVWWWETGECAGRPGGQGPGAGARGLAGGRAPRAGVGPDLASPGRGAWAATLPGTGRRGPGSGFFFWWVGRREGSAIGGRRESELHPPAFSAAR